MNKLIFMPNVGEDNFISHTKEDIQLRLAKQKSADFPEVASLGRVATKGSLDGMVPLNNKTNR
jgi:hypothetical protein